MFWPDNAQIAVTTSLMFEAGSQDPQKTFGPFPVAQEGDFPDLPTNSWFDYAANEGIQRALDPSPAGINRRRSPPCQLRSTTLD